MVTPLRTRIVAASFTATLLLVGLVPLSAAGSADDPEITDAFGDANPAAGIAGLPAEATAPGRAPLFDLGDVWIGAEGSDSFGLVLRAADLPDTWTIEEGEPGQPLGPLAPGSGGAAFQPDALAPLVEYTAYFRIGDRDYHLVASLYEFQVYDPNQVDIGPESPAGAFLAAAQNQLEELAGVPGIDPAWVEAIARTLDDVTALIEDPPAAPDAVKQVTDAVADLVYTLCVEREPAQPVHPALRQASCDAKAQLDPEAIKKFLEEQWPEVPETDPKAIKQAIEEELDRVIEDLQALKEQVEDQIPGVDPDPGAIDPVVQDAQRKIDDALVTVRGLRHLLTGILYDALTTALQGLHDTVGIVADEFGLDNPVPTDPAPQLTEDLCPAGGICFTGTGVGASAPGTPQEAVAQALAQADALKAWLDGAPSLAEHAPDPTTFTPPSAFVYHQFTLYDADGTSTPLPNGAVDVEEDTVQVQVPKAAVGSPGAGSVLTRFRAEAAFEGVKIDFAPDARSPTPDDGETSLVEGLFQREFVAPTYGRDYAFRYAPPAGHTGQGPGGDPGTGGEDPPAATRVSVVVQGLAEAAIEPGGATTYAFTVANPGPEPSRGLLYLSAAAPGWTHALSDTSWDLAAGESLELRLTVTAVGGGDEELVSRVTVSPEGGESTTHEFRTIFAAQSDEAEPASGSTGLAWAIVAAVAALGTAAVGAVFWIRRK